MAELTDLLAYASAEVTRIAPLALDVVHNRAAISASSATSMTVPQQGVRWPMRTLFAIVRGWGYAFALSGHTEAGARQRLKQQLLDLTSNGASLALNGAS